MPAFSSAKLLRRIGQAVGQHFDLLDGEQPTELFTTFFGQTLADLDDQLQRSVQMSTFLVGHDR